MSGKAIIILVTGIIIISSIIFYQINAASTRITENFAGYYQRQSAKNIAQSGINLGLRQFGNDTTRNWRGTIGTMTSPFSMLGGKVAVTVSDSTLFGRPVIKFFSVGIVDRPWEYLQKDQIRQDTVIAFLPRKFHPLTVQGAVSTRNPVDANGNFTIDGRNHTPAGALIGGTGILAVWTTRTFNQGGSCNIGGTWAGVDYAPSKPGNPLVIKTNQAWVGGYPGTPDSILGGLSNGFPEGTLKAVAQSRAGGSQYVTNASALTFPLRGVTYFEPPSSGGTLSNISGSGLLIVHNSSLNALIENTTGNFSGVIIADDVTKIHSTVIGAVISITLNPSEGNVIGNGNGAVLYSREAVIGITDMIYSLLYTNGSQTNVISWWE